MEHDEPVQSEGREVEPLPPDAVVVRGGTMQLDDLLNNALSHNDKTAGREWALSCNSIAGLAAEEIAKRARRPNLKMCVSRVDRLRDLGYEVRPDGLPNGHCNIMLKGEPTMDDLQRIRSIFSDPIPNPGRPQAEGANQ
jgi:hypothetical protein